MRTLPLALTAAAFFLTPAFAQSGPPLLAGLPPLRTQLALGQRAAAAPPPVAALRPEATPQQRAWKRSLIALAASQSLDAVSSYGMRELNPLMASPDGRFGAKAVSIKAGATAAIVLAEHLIVQKHPAAARLFSHMNWSNAVLTTAVAAHNFAIR